MLCGSNTATPVQRPADDSHDTYDFDDEDDYFFQTYAPLSCLPTPPASCHTSSPRKTPAEFEPDDSVDAALLGPAIHLSNLIPSAASLVPPSFSLVQTLLSRAALPLDTLALAVCILDSLTSRFAACWRRSIPLPTSDPSKRHVDCIRPEVIVLSALLIAVKFLDDVEIHTRTFQTDIADGRWSCDQINVTEQCILDNLGWRIKPLWQEDLIQDARDDMRRAGMLANSRRQSAAFTHLKMGQGRKISEGVLCDAQGQLTPVESPVAKGRSG